MTSPVVLRKRVAVRHLPGLLAVLLLGGCAIPQPRGEGRMEQFTEPQTNRKYWLYLPPPGSPAGQDQEPAPRSPPPPQSPHILQVRRPLVLTFHGLSPWDGARAQARERQQEADGYNFRTMP